MIQRERNGFSLASFTVKSPGRILIGLAWVMCSLLGQSQWPGVWQEEEALEEREGATIMERGESVPADTVNPCLLRLGGVRGKVQEGQGKKDL